MAPNHGQERRSLLASTTKDSGLSEPPGEAGVEEIPEPVAH
jgi:hypothetical protein